MKKFYTRFLLLMLLLSSLSFAGERELTHLQKLKMLDQAIFQEEVFLASMKSKNQPDQALQIAIQRSEHRLVRWKNERNEFKEKYAKEIEEERKNKERRSPVKILLTPKP